MDIAGMLRGENSATDSTIERILVAWEQLSGMKRSRLVARNRTMHESRRIVMCALRAVGISLPDIGWAVHRDHSTVLYQLRRCRDVDREAAGVLLREAGLI